MSELAEFKIEPLDPSKYKFEIHHVFSSPLTQQLISFDQEIQRMNKVMREIKYSPWIYNSLITNENIDKVFEKSCDSFITVFSCHGTDSG